MAWVKGLHIISIILWSAALIYLPILMAGHNPRVSNRAYVRLHGIVRSVYLWVASPFAIASIVTGTILIFLRDVTEPWFVGKLLVVAVLAGIHGRCGVVLAKLSHDAERASTWVRAIRIVSPIVLFPCVLWLVLAKPNLPSSIEPSTATWVETLRRVVPPLFERVSAAQGVEPGFETDQVVVASIEKTSIKPLSRPHVLQIPACLPANQLLKPARSPISKAEGPKDKLPLQDRISA